MHPDGRCLPLDCTRGWVFSIVTDANLAIGGGDVVVIVGARRGSRHVASRPGVARSEVAARTPDDADRRPRRHDVYAACGAGLAAPAPAAASALRPAGLGACSTTRSAVAQRSSMLLGDRRAISALDLDGRRARRPAGSRGSASRTRRTCRPRRSSRGRRASGSRWRWRCSCASLEIPIADHPTSMCRTPRAPELVVRRADRQRCRHRRPACMLPSAAIPQLREIADREAGAERSASSPGMLPGPPRRGSVRSTSPHDRGPARRADERARAAPGPCRLALAATQRGNCGAVPLIVQREVWA